MNKIKIKLNKNTFWYAIGSFTYAFSSILLTMVVVSFIGKEEGGIFNYGFSTLGQHFFILSYFGVRSLHIADIEKQYSFFEYKKHRECTSLASILILFIFLISCFLFNDYSLKKILILFILSSNNIFEGFMDVYDCEMQRKNRLDLTGKAIFFRIIIYDFVLITSIILFKNLFISIILALIAKILVAYITSFNKKFLFDDLKYNQNKIKNLFKESLPLFLTIFLDFFIFAISKYTIEYILGDIQNGYYAIYFMPSSLLFVFASFIIRPHIGALSSFYHSKSNKEYKNLRKKVYTQIIMLSLLLLLIISLSLKISLPILDYFTSYAYKDMHNTSKIIIILSTIAGMFYSLSSLAYYILVIKNKQKSILYIYIFIFILSICLSLYFVNEYGIIGASIAHITIMILLFLALFWKESSITKEERM
ncbi:MAG: oligosaccharide flippase family protein [Eubacteriales bacterium]|nr:oligosaccharide flippase family protein [Eubacteriales bacterium]